VSPTWQTFVSADSHGDGRGRRHGSENGSESGESSDRHIPKSYRGDSFPGGHHYIPPGPERDRICSEALQLAGLPVTPQNMADAKRLAQKESGWDAHNQNNWDINARRGHPSKGLVQTIKPTFDRYHAPGHDDIWNPVDNMAAGIRYATARYGRRGGLHYAAHVGGY
jgi:hypothetical protein